MATYNGHRNYNYWNVSLWINNDESLYGFARFCITEARKRRLPKRDAARAMLEGLTKGGKVATPDGVRYSAANIAAAMRGM